MRLSCRLEGERPDRMEDTILFCVRAFLGGCCFCRQEGKKFYSFVFFFARIERTSGDTRLPYKDNGFELFRPARSRAIPFSSEKDSRWKGGSVGKGR